MARPLRNLSRFFLLAAGAIALGLAYWQLVAAPSLLDDAAFNAYRIAVSAREDQRGRILDRNGEVLAFSERTADGFVRRYPYAAIGPVTGYWSLLHGSAGLEAAYDQPLRGERSAGLAARWQRLLHRPVVGADVVTTIDLRIQRAADEALGNARGAALAIDPRTGEILAMASHPFADPNRIDAAWSQVVSDQSAPLYNRATLGLYAPGSTFKTVTFTAALASGAVKPDTVFEDPDNGIVIDRVRIPDPNHPGIPRFDAMHALAYSSNSAFAEIGVTIGGDALREQARKFGFEAPIPFELPTSPSQLANSAEFLRSRLGVATTAIGQGQLLVSPMQMALVSAAIANGGTQMQPRLVREVRTADGEILARSGPSVMANPMSPEVARTVGEAMALAVRESSASSAALPNVQVAGKTGTAEIDAGARTHAWYIAFAPLDKPRIAVAVIEEQAGGGATVAGPIARRILEVGLAANSS